MAGRAVGVYVGGFTMDNQMLRQSSAARSSISTHTATSGTYTMLSNRISFVYDLHGPSMTIDTACSSSLVALHEANQALQRGEIEMAIVAGVNALLAPETFVAMCKGRFLAPDGRCKTFDAAADGYARGEGAGVLVLRPLERAVADGDRVYAVLRATGVNQDGRTPGITVPNPKAQADLVREVVARADVDPAQIGYVEAHGTGTAVGDPLEMAALGETLGAVEGRTEPLRVGSIKAPIGHLEAAAGVSSVIKAALTLHHRQIAPQGWLNELNPAIPFEQHRLRVPVEPEPFPAGYARPAAAVNGFGYGGTNAHAILLAHEPQAAPGDGRADGRDDVRAAVRDRAPETRVMPVSGRNEAGVRAFAADLAEHLAATTTDVAGADRVADALWVRRAHQPYRAGVGYTDREDLLTALQEIAAGTRRAGARALLDGTGPVLVLSGMGPQWWGMARDLLTAGGTFARVAEDVDKVWTELSGSSLIDELLRPEETSRVTSTPIAQGGNFLVQVALVAQLAEYGVRPAAVLGHSVGEVSAAHVSGMLSLRDAVSVSYHRGRLQARQAGTGGMLAVGLAEQDALARIADLPGVEVAAVNSPGGVTLAGDQAPLTALAERLTAEGVFARALRVEVPYHSHLMDPILPELPEALAHLDPGTPQLPLYSTVRGAAVTGDGDLWDAAYWADNVRRPVRFADAVAAAVTDGHRVFLEVGPHPVLSGNVREILVRRGESGTSIPTLNRTEPDRVSLRTAHGELYGVGALGADAPPGGLLGPVPQQPLPVHAFQRTELWSLDERIARDYLGDSGITALPGVRTDAHAPEWESEAAVSRLPWLPDHVAAGMRVLPGAAYLDAALAAAAELTGAPTLALRDVAFVNPLAIGEHEAPVLRLSVDGDTNRFVVRSRPADSTGWTLHARGRVVDAPVTAEPLAPYRSGGLGPVLAGAELYRQLDAVGLSYGPQFRRIVEIAVTRDEVLALVDAAGAPGRHQAHPAVVDCALQCVAAWVAGGEVERTAMVPAAMAAVRQLAALPEQVQVRVCRLTPREGEAELVADIVMAALDGTPVLQLDRVQFRPITPRPPLLTELAPLFYELRHVPLPGRAPRLDGPGADLLVLSCGGAADPVAERLAAAAGVAVRPVTGAGPQEVEEAVLPLLRRALDADPWRLTVVLCATGPVEPDGADGAGLADLDALAAPTVTLTGLARAVQTVVEETEARTGAAPAVEGVVVTRCAVGIDGDPGCELPGATLTGARRVLRNEQPAQRWRGVDVDDEVGVQELLDEIVVGALTEPEPDEVVLRGGGLRLGLRVDRTLPERLAALESVGALTDPERNFALELPTSRLLSEVGWREVPRRAPGAGELEIRITGLELNAKDAAKAAGMIGPADLTGTHFGTELGMHAMGVVERLGAGVTQLEVGDVVMVGVPGMARRYLTTRYDPMLVDRGPAPWTKADYGSGVPLRTAHFCVHDAARVQPGETVLVHGAAGGVGMAATVVAKAAGARVSATASTPERREVARSLGADEVLDSRSITFVEQVRRLTGGRGADVVISSAPGEFVAANLEAAAEFGRVVEVGKTEIFADRAISLRPFEKNLSFISVDFDRLMATRPERAVEIAYEVLHRVEDGTYRALPALVVPADEIGQALGMVLRSTHVGRIVVDLDALPSVRPPAPDLELDPRARYLVTGGLGAVGLATATWLADRGARHLVLVGRRGVSTPEAARAVEALTARGLRMTVEQLDVADAGQVHDLLDRMQESGPPLRGVFHAAGVLRDEPYHELTDRALREVLAPKALGALNLHHGLAAVGIEVDHFVLYSSVAALSGNVPQTSYAAANTLLDALARHRRATGRAATSVNWGVLGGGMAASSEQISRYLAAIGMTPIELDRACALLEPVLALGTTHVSVAAVDWARWGQSHPASAGVLRFEDLVRSAGSGQSASGALRAELAALAVEQRLEVFTYLLAEQVSAVLGVPSESLDVETPLAELGMDSLMGVELSARIDSTLDLEVPALEFTRGGGLSHLAGRLLERMEVGA